MSQDTSDIHRAVMDGNLNIVKMLLAEDPKLAIFRDVDSRTPIHWACSFQHYEILEALLDPNHFSKEGLKVEIDINDLQDNSQWTPLHIAASVGNLEILKLLMIHVPKPDVNLQTSTGQTCLHYAVVKNHFPIVEYLLKDCKASARIKDNKNQLPLHRAAAIGSAKMVDWLVQVGKSPLNTKDIYGYTPLHHALAEGHADVGIQLVKYGADWKTETLEGQTALDIASNEKVRSWFKRSLEENM